MNKKVAEYISITKLSQVKQADLFEKEGKGYFYTHQGAQACVFHNGESMCYIGYVEFAPMRSRGNHYHSQKHENICIINGSMLAKFILPERPNDVYEVRLEQGDIVHIEPGCAHSFLSEKGAIAVEYSPEKFKRKDTIRYSFNWDNEVN